MYLLCVQHDWILYDDSAGTVAAINWVWTRFTFYVLFGTILQLYHGCTTNTAAGPPTGSDQHDRIQLSVAKCKVT